MQKIVDSLALQKRELDAIPGKEYVARDVKLADIDKPIAKVIVGPRRAGKSYFALHEASKAGRIGYLNFDDEVLSKVEDYNLLVEAAKIVYAEPKMLLLDEVQNLRDWELFVNRLQRQGYNLIITGSNSRLLSRELSTHLTGRHLAFVIFPFSFAEYLKYFARDPAVVLTEAEKKARFADYRQRGGYPEPLVKGLGYKDYLDSLYGSLLYKDITLRYRPRAPQSLKDLASWLIANAGNHVSYNRLTRLTGIRNVNTVAKYLGYLEEAFVLFTVGAFSFKKREQIRSPRKVFAIDNGFIFAGAGSFSPNTGKLSENSVAVELKKRSLMEGWELFYYRNAQGYEVDFVVKEGSRITRLIQVSHDPSDERTRRRETRALLYASRETGCREMMILTDDYEAEENIEWFGMKGKVSFRPVWKWLLE